MSNNVLYLYKTMNNDSCRKAILQQVFDLQEINIRGRG